MLFGVRTRNAVLRKQRESTAFNDMVAILDDLIRRLDCPLTDERRAEGWYEGAQEVAIEHFTALRAKLRKGEGPDESDVGAGLSRWLDTFGVHSGPVLMLASRLSVLMFDHLDEELSSFHPSDP